MQRIIAPLQFGDRGSTVANLQDALQLFCDRKTSFICHLFIVSAIDL